MAIKKETELNNFKINYLSEELYKEAVKNGNINPNELYMTPDMGSVSSINWDDILNKPSTFTPSSHTHYKSQILDFPSSLPASDVYPWAKEYSKPSYNKSEIGLGNVDNTADRDKSVKYATTAGSVSSVSWQNINGKPSDFPPASHTHANYLDSSFNGYNLNDLTNPSYFAVWGNNQIRTLSTNNVRNIIGAASSEHSHSEYATTYHSHNEYASVYHAHSEYAPNVHSHVKLGYYEPSYQNEGDLWLMEV